MGKVSCLWGRFGAVAGLLALAVVLSGGAAAGEQKLAIVNVSLVFEKYDKVPDVQRKIDAGYQEKKDELNKRATELAKRNKDVEQFFNQQTQSEEVFNLVQRLRKEQFLFERDLGALNADIQRDYTREMRAVLTDIRVAVRAVADKGGYDLVLRSPDADDPEVKDADPNQPPSPAARDNKTYLELVAPRTADELVERFNRNPVLFGARPVDITKDVLAKLNDDYLKRSIGIGTGPKK